MAKYSPEISDVEALSSARKEALVENILRTAKDADYWQFIDNSPKESLVPKAPRGNFSGELCKHAVEITLGEGYDRKLKIDGEIIQWRSTVGGKQTESVHPSDPQAIDDFFTTFESYLKRRLEEDVHSTFEKRIGSGLPQAPKKMG